MEKLNFFVPQWQGSGITKDLYDGSHALKKYIEAESSCSFETIELAETGDLAIKNNILGYDAILKQLTDIQTILDKRKPSRIFTIGGGCGIEIPIVSYFLGKYPNLTLFWFDAHGDLNSPKSSPSKHFHGMPLRFLLDPGISLPGIAIRKIAPDAVHLPGVRDLDEPEEAYIHDKAINCIPIESLQGRNPQDENLFESLFKLGKGKVYIHIDLDVLDPEEYRNVKCPVKRGLSVEDLIVTLHSINRNMNVVGISIVENTAVDSEEIAKLENIIEFGIKL